MSSLKKYNMCFKLAFPYHQSCVLIKDEEIEVADFGLDMVEKPCTLLTDVKKTELIIFLTGYNNAGPVRSQMK